jgi:two-component system, OmpR family, sensor histidine kinase AdeS
MGLVSFITALIGFVGSIVVYGVLYTVSPPPTPLTTEDAFIPDPSDYLIFASFVLAGLLVAVFFASRLARRILTPLNSLAESARSIAAGNLDARAQPGDRSLGETASLVDDFNTMAERLQRMTSDMTTWNAAIAHELRTPLTILRGRLQGIEDGVFAPDEGQIRSLLFQVKSLNRLVDDLRTVTLQQVGRLEMNLEVVRIDYEIQTAVDLISEDLKQSGLSIRLRLEPILVKCDAIRIQQAMLALLDNARRYAFPGEIAVHVEAVSAAVRIAVHDQGPGLAADFSLQVFEPFTRADASRSRAFGGSGLGLSVVRAIALAHHGTIRYRTNENGGATFEVTLPL